MSVKYTNNASSLLIAAITSGETTFSISSGTGILFPSTGASDHYYATISNLAGNVEIVKVTGRATDTFTVQRGADGTSAQAWSLGDTVELRLTAALLDDIQVDVKNSPTLTTPVLGVASATTINKVSITAPATSAVLTIADGVTLSAGANASVSGSNTGDNATNSQYSGLVTNATHSGDATGATALTVVGINGVNLASLATGILKNTISTGVPTIAQAGTDYVVPATLSSYALLNSPSFTTPTLGAASCTTINNLTPTSQSIGFTLAGGTTSKTLTVTESGTIAASSAAFRSDTYFALLGGGSGTAFSCSTLTASGKLTLNTTSTGGAMLINRTDVYANGITAYQTNSVDKWTLGLRNTGDDIFRLYSFVASADILAVSSTGLAVTGSVSATTASGGTTSCSISRGANTDWEYFSVNPYGAASPTNPAWRTGIQGGTSALTTWFDNGTSNVTVTQVSSTGLAVTGSVSATGVTNGIFFTDRANASTAGWYRNSNIIILNSSDSGSIVNISPTTGVYTAISDINKKKDFSISTIGLDAILGIEPTLYRMKSQKKDTPLSLGFIAQQVKDFIPQAYVENDDFIGLDTTPILATAVKAIQELNAKVKALEATS
jgi:hypothetical protein